MRGDRFFIGLILFAAVLAAARPSLAGDPQPYALRLEKTSEAPLDSALLAASQLESLREKAPVGPIALIIRAREDRGRLKRVLESFAYYDGHIEVTIDGRPLDDPGLPDDLSNLPKGRKAEVKIRVVRGPAFHLGTITVVGSVPADAREKLGLTSGQRALAADVLAAGARLLSALREEGYALARVDQPVATLRPEARALDVTYKADPGRKARIGAIRFEGLVDVEEAFVRRHLKLESGEVYRQSRIDAARRALAALDVFSSVQVRTDDAIAADGTLGITFVVTERPRRTIALTGSYSTDLGVGAKLSWSHHNLFGAGEQLNLSAANTGVGGTDSRAPGYDLRAQFIKPDFRRVDQALEFDFAALKQDLQAYDVTSQTLSGLLRRKLNEVWTISGGVSGEQARFVQEGITRNYTLLSVPLAANFDTAHPAQPLDDPTHGVRGSVTLTPAHSFAVPDSNFVSILGTAATYYDLADLGWSAPSRSVLALRASLGGVEGAGTFDLPPDQRFYGGGSATIRGYRYQSVGPLFADGRPTGGTSLDAATIEYRQRIEEDYGAVAFLDAGQVSERGFPFAGTLREGAGFGIRYYTSIGPLRLDFAVPINPPPHVDSFEIYIGLGQAF